MARANSIANISMLLSALAREKTPPRWKEKGRAILITTLGIIVTSGVCLMTLSLNHPIFISNKAQAASISQEEILKEEIKTWETSLIKKYQGAPIYRPATGVAHIKLTKYINGAPVRINIVEINPKINSDLVIKPETAGEKLNSKASIRSIANKTDSLVAVNGGYFKPETGVPLGTLMVDNKTLTGPIYNRVGIGISQNELGTNFSMGRVELTMEIKNKNTSIKVDNINQPRMLSTYSLVYTPDWGKMSPPAPKYGAIAVIQEGKVTNVTQASVEIPQNGYVLSAPADTISKILTQKNLELLTSYPSEFEGANHIIGGGPYLMKDGQVYVDTAQQKLNAITGRNPRSAIGYTQNGELILVTVDGREQSSVGMTLEQLAGLMKNLGCYNAMNFDGGGSSVMYVNGKITNSPAQREGIAISNALTIKVKKV